MDIFHSSNYKNKWSSEKTSNWLEVRSCNPLYKALIYAIFWYPLKYFSAASYQRRNGMNAPPRQTMSCCDHVQRRKEEKGCFYAWFVLIVKSSLFEFSSSIFNLYFCLWLDCVCVAACSRCAAVVAATRLVSPA